MERKTAHDFDQDLLILFDAYAHGEARSLVEEAAAVDDAVDVGVEQDEQVLIEVVGGFTVHGGRPLGRGSVS